jgi:hypothetical protein
MILRRVCEGNFVVNEDVKKILEFIQDIAQAIRSGPTERVLASITALCLSTVTWLAHEKGFPGYPQTIWGMALIGGVSFVWLGVKSIRQALPPAPPTEEVVPSVVRGLSPFTLEDGELFWKLGRNLEIQELLAMLLQNSSPLVVLRGQSGSGKTSLLRAGLQYALQQRRIACAYWEATTENAFGAFSFELRRQLGIDLPLDLMHLVTAIKEPSVVIIDQFEQLRRVEEHAGFFNFLEYVCKSPIPHQLKVVIAFQEHYDSAWLDFEEELQIQAEKLSIKPFGNDRAKEIMATVLDDASIRVEDGLLRNYITSVAGVAGISPVDIGMGILVLANWNQQHSHKDLTLEEYLAAGGAAGILSFHVQDRLSPAYVRVIDRERLLRGLISGLVDDEHNQRKRASAEIIAGLASLDISRVHSYLAKLTGPNARVLEKTNDADGVVEYQLSHERLIPVLTQMTEEQGGVSMRPFLADQFSQWKRTGSSKYLLSGKALKIALAYKTKVFTGVKLQDQKEYLRESVHRRRRRRSVVVVTCLLIALVSYITFHFLAVSVQRAQLKKWLLPSDLYDQQSQLESLEISGPPVTELKWLNSRKLHRLDIKGSLLASLAGISNDKRLEDLTLDLTKSPILNLDDVSRLNNLQHLSLYLGQSKIQNLTDLASLQELNSLVLHLGSSSIHTLVDVAQLKGLRSLTLYLEGSQIQNLADLGQLRGLQELVLHLEGPPYQNLADLAQISGLRSLTLHAGESSSQSMADLVRIQGLQNLTLDLHGSKLQHLPDLAQLDQLRSLTLNLKFSQVQSLTGLIRLRRLQNLDLNLEGSPIRDLTEVSQLRGLQNLKIALTGPEVESLPDLSQLDALLDVNLNLRFSRIKNLSSLAQLRELRRLSLNLRFSEIQNLTALEQLSGLESLALDLSLLQLQNLPDLGQLQRLQSLVLNLEETPVSNLPKLPKLRSLTLNLDGAQTENLPDLTAYKNLENLTLNLAFSRIRNIDQLSQLSSLQYLDLNLSSSQVRTLPDLTQLTKLQSLTLNLEESQIQELPKLAHLNELKNVIMNLRHSQIADLHSIHGLTALRELTLDQKFQSLTDLPDSVNKLNFVW